MRISSRKRRKMRKARLAKIYNTQTQNSNYSRSEELEKNIKEAWVDISNNEIINEEINDVDDHEESTSDEYDANPPICCRLLKRIGICYMLKRYFKKRSRRIYPRVNEA